MTLDEKRLDWEIDYIRREISIDWAKLASKTLAPEKRKIIREHLKMNMAALHELKQQQQLGTQNVKAESSQISIWDFSEPLS